jgi:cytochrome P450
VANEAALATDAVVERSFAGTTFRDGAGPAVDEMVWLSTYANVAEVFRSRDFEQGGGGRRDSAAMVGDCLLALSGRDHFERRRIDATVFRRSVLVDLERNVLDARLSAALDERARQRGSDGVVRAELINLLRNTMCHVQATFGGIDGVDTPQQVERYIGYLARMGHGTDVEWETRDHHQVLEDALAARELFVRDFFAPSFRRRADLVEQYEAGRLPASELPNDLLTIMLLHRAHFERWDDGIYLRELTIFGTGSITKGVPHVLAEMDHWLQAHPDDRAHLGDAHFLRRAALEALRLHPPSPFFIRQAVRDVTLTSGRSFLAGTYVVLDVTRASRDPLAVGTDPDRFDMRRLPTAKLKPAGLVFGDGPHTCIGMTLSIGDTAASQDEATTAEGMVVHILRRLHAAGVRPDPASPPTWNDANVRNEYVRFPVVFESV